MKRMLAKLFLRLTGWKAEGGKPVESKFVLIAAPHTSNWDLAYLLAFSAIYDVRVSWMGKHTLFRAPMGSVMRALGGIPVRRERRTNMVDAMAAEFARRDRLALVVPTEGTRGYTAHWKSGFYHIASKAGVPIVMGFLDYRRRRAQCRTYSRSGRRPGRALTRRSVVASRPPRRPRRSARASR